MNAGTRTTPAAPTELAIAASKRTMNQNISQCCIYLSVTVSCYKSLSVDLHDYAETNRRGLMTPEWHLLVETY